MTFEDLRRVLDATGPASTPREIAEVVWLARFLPGAEPEAESPPERGADAPADPPGPKPSPSPSPRPEPAPGPVPAPEPDPYPIHVPRPAPAEEADESGDVLVPTAPMLRHPLYVQRALRPLKRRIASRDPGVLDEEATAARIAARPDAPWTPVLVPSAERWLSLALVVDTGASMRMWWPLARELRETLLRLGAFRDVRVWFMADTGGVRAAPRGPVMAPASLVDPSGRQVVLVLSDCSGPHWWQGRAGAALHVWGTAGPTAILQPLPERMWRRSAAPVTPGTALLPRSGAPNTELRFTPREGVARGGRGAVPVPVLEIAPEWLADWARLVTATGEESKPTAITYAAARPRRRELPGDPPIEEQVAAFHSVASPEAAELAAHVAVSVPALPVMRLIQHRILRSSRPSVLAEVLLSGLLEPVDAERGRYGFVAGARETLLATLPRPETLATAEVLAKVSEEIRARAGGGGETFRAATRAAPGTGTRAADFAGLPFALVDEGAMRFLRHTAVPLTDGPPPESAPEPPPRPVPGPPVPRAESGWPSFAVADEDGGVQVWNPVGGWRVEATLPAGQGEFGGMALLPGDGPVRLAVGGDVEAVRVWEARPAGPVTYLFGERATAVAAFDDADGREHVVAGTASGDLHYWELQDPGTARVRSGLHTGEILAMARYPDPASRTVVATGGEDGEVRVRGIDRGKTPSFSLRLDMAVWAVAPIPVPEDRALLAIGCQNGEVVIWRLNADRDPLTYLPGHEGTVWTLATFTAPDGRTLLASGGTGGDIRIWDPVAGVQVGAPLTGHEGWVWDITCFTDAEGRSLLASVGDDGAVRVWDPTAGVQLGEYRLGGDRRPRAIIALPRTTARTPASAYADLMKPERKVVPFHGREEELAELHEWFEGPTSVAAVLIGPTGEGKTRLAQEFAARLEAEGRPTSYLPHPGVSLTEADFEGGEGGRLLIIDRAEQSDQDLIDFASDLSALLAGTRILFLSRHAVTVPEHSGVRELRLGPLHKTPERRQAEFTMALDHFARALRMPTPVEASPPELDATGYQRISAIHLAALMTLVTEPLTDSAERLDTEVRLWHELHSDDLLRADQDLWRTVPAAAGLGVPPGDMPPFIDRLPWLRAIAPTTKAYTIAQVLGTFPFVFNVAVRDRPRPEQLADALIADTVRRHPEFVRLFRSCFAGHPPRFLAQAEDTLRRVLSKYPHVDAPAAPPAVSFDRLAETLLGLHGPDELDPVTAWAPRPAEQDLRIPLGIGRDGAPAVLDLKEPSGPHGLITGGGHEDHAALLATFVLGLAVAHPPGRVGFAIATGSGAAGRDLAKLAALPHISGNMLDLSTAGRDLPAQVRRLSEALQAELQHRWEAVTLSLFEKHLLFVVLEDVDTLLDAYPALAETLEDLLLTGEEYGIRLLLTAPRWDSPVLQTAYDDFHYRIVLRTATPQESELMLGVPDAYGLLAEEAILKTGAGPSVQFRLSTAARRTADQYVAPLSTATYGHSRLLWPPLNEPPTLGQIKASHPSRQQSKVAPIGVVDLPAEHGQEILQLQLSGSQGNVAVVGAAGSGMATFLQTVIASLAHIYSPDEVRFYAIDCQPGPLSQLAELRHMAKLATNAEASRCRDIVREVADLLTGDDHPHTYLVVDGWGAFQRTLHPPEVLLLNRLVTEGPARNVNLIVGAAEWAPFRWDGFPTRFELRLPYPGRSQIDPERAAEIPPDRPGRGITQEGHHFSTALPRLDGRNTTDDLAKGVAHLVATINRQWEGAQD
ncbi:SAV_2336 N-terminal domain-related protein [Spirillospora sp. CA-253888]